jgi:hypothetical protein
VPFSPTPLASGVELVTPVGTPEGARTEEMLEMTALRGAAGTPDVVVAVALCPATSPSGWDCGWFASTTAGTAGALGRAGLSTMLDSGLGDPAPLMRQHGRTTAEHRITG